MRHPLSILVLLAISSNPFYSELTRNFKNYQNLIKISFCNLILRKSPHKTPFEHTDGWGTVAILGLLKDKVLLLVQAKSGMGLPLHPWFQQSFSIVRPPRCTCFFAPIPCLIVCDVAYYVRMPKKFYDLALEEI